MEHRDIKPVAWARSKRDSYGIRLLFFVVLGGTGRLSDHIRRQTDMNIAIGSDHAGYRLKEEIKSFIEAMGHHVMDVGCHCEDSVDYPDYALPVCQKVTTGEAERGILICGTGIGMSMAANKTKGIRCALAHDTFSAKATREHNDANVLALGERIIGPGLAQDIVKLFLETPFSGADRHQKRVDKVEALEKEN